MVFDLSSVGVGIGSIMPLSISGAILEGQCVGALNLAEKSSVMPRLVVSLRRRVDDAVDEEGVIGGVMAPSQMSNVVVSSR